MAISINTNVGSLMSQKNLNTSSDRLRQSMSRLSSGLRVRSAADDAAGLAISETFKAKIRSLDQAQRNANDGVSLAQTADGALSEMGSMLGRMRELAVQAKNGTVHADQRAHLAQEFGELKEEITRIANSTEFNGVKLLDGSNASGINFQVGSGNTADDTLTLSLAEASVSALALNAATLSDETAAGTALGSIDGAIKGIAERRATLGAMQNRLQVTMSNISTYKTNLEAANSRIVDVDVAAETARLTREQILVQAGASMLAQANQSPQIALSLLR